MFHTFSFINIISDFLLLNFLLSSVSISLTTSTWHLHGAPRLRYQRPNNSYQSKCAIHVTLLFIVFRPYCQDDVQLNNHERKVLLINKKKYVMNKSKVENWQAFHLHRSISPSILFPLSSHLHQRWCSPFWCVSTLSFGLLLYINFLCSAACNHLFTLLLCRSFHCISSKLFTVRLYQIKLHYIFKISIHLYSLMDREILAKNTF